LAPLAQAFAWAFFCHELMLDASPVVIIQDRLNDLAEIIKDQLLKTIFSAKVLMLINS